jgi:D-psicose/D-tagatose/L-ribulose 3-epimerase
LDRRAHARGLESAIEQAAECGYRIIELAYLRPEMFDLDRLSKRAKAADLAIVVTMGLPMSADVSSDDPQIVIAGETLLSHAVKAVRDIGGIRLGGVLYSAHAKYAKMPTDRGRKHSIAAIAKTADIAKQAGVELVLEIVNRFETYLLNTAQQGLDFIKGIGVGLRRSAPRYLSYEYRRGRSGDGHSARR